MLTAKEVVDHYYLETRCMLVEIASVLDRYERAKEKSPSENGHERNGCELGERGKIEQLYQALDILSERGASTNRSERLLLHFSDPE